MSDNAEPSDRNQKKRAWLVAHQTSLGEMQRRWQRTERNWSLARLGVFAAVVGIWITCSDHAPLAWGGTLTGVLIFAWAVSRHRYAKRNRAFHDRLLVMAGECLQRFGGKIVLIRGKDAPPDADAPGIVAALLDDGPTWHLTNQERDDLDFHSGPVGFFGLINRTSTALGRRRLYRLASRSCLSVATIQTRQKSVQWLDDHAAQRIRLMAGAASLRNQEAAVENFVTAMDGASWILANPISSALRTWSVLSGLFSLYALYRAGQGETAWGWVFGGVLVANGLIFARLRSRIADALHRWRGVIAGVQGMESTVDVGAKDLPEAGELGELRGAFHEVSKARVLRSLLKWLAWCDSGGPFHTLFNYLFLFDLHIVEGILRSAVPLRSKLQSAFSALADLEMLTSLACFAWEQPVSCYPKLADTPTLWIEAGTHPLLDPDRTVANDVQLDDVTRMWIITGSNMSGKSTFLRMASANVLLAQMGTVACARSMTLSPFRLVTDLNVRDDLAASESYFLAEVHHLKRLVLPPPGDAPVLGIVDEPFRGTNASEQVAASVAVVQYLKGTSNLFLLATHERNVTKQADDRTILNRHFRECLNDGELVFDYTLRSGPAESRNALLVLEREGYPEAVLTTARRWLEGRGES